MAEQSEDRDERQLPASERKLRKAREDGQVPRSREAAHAAALLAAIGTLAAYGPSLAQGTLDIVRGGLRFDRDASRDPERALASAAAAAGEALWTVLPLLFAPLAAAIAATLAVGGLVYTFKPVTPDLSRIDPFAGIGRLFSLESAIGVLKLAAIASAVGGVGVFFAADGFGRFAGYAGMPLPAALGAAGLDLRTGMLWAAGVVVVAALIDGPTQVWQFGRKMRMTPQEAKQEYREAEGDPRQKGMVRQRQREMARGRMLAAVPAASVVVTNPTHFAVALAYDEGSSGAPRVVAKGADLLAARIREIAAESGVPLLESPPLARALYRHVEIDQEIPAALYTAVAQVLAWVHQLGRHRAGGGAPPHEPAIEVPPGFDPQEADR